MKKVCYFILALAIIVTMMSPPITFAYTVEPPNNSSYNDSAQQIPRGSGTPSKAIVVIPGILCTELYYNSMCVWPNFESTTMQYLALSETGVPSYSLTPKNNYGILYTYQALIEELERNFYDYGYDVIFFDYDWRLDNSHTALLLANELSGYSEVILIGHSMGGLVASKFLDNSAANRAKTIAVFTLGTPFLGSVKAIGAMENGQLITDNNGDYMYEAAVMSIARNSFAAYQLLPTPSYGTMINTAPIYVGNTSRSDTYNCLKNCEWGKTASGSTKIMFDTANSFHTALGSPTSHIIKTSGVPTYIITGTGQSTPLRVWLNSDMTFDMYTTTNSGDGTVVTASATIGMNHKPFPVKHEKLPRDDDVIRYIVSSISTELGLASTYSSNSQTTEEYNQQSSTINDKGWIQSGDNRRITIVAQGTVDLLKDGKPVTIIGDSVYDANGAYIGAMWLLGANGRVQFELHPGSYLFSCNDYVKVIYMNSGYFEGLYEYSNFDNNQINFEVSDYLAVPDCLADDFEVVFTELSADQLDELNRR